jgi:hypothetical protein
LFLQYIQYIKAILNNNYPPQTYQNIKTKINNRTPDTPQKQKFATFTYIGTETRIINLFKKHQYTRSIQNKKHNTTPPATKE